MEIILKKLNEIQQSLLEGQLKFKEHLTVSEASIYLGISKSAVHKLTAKRELSFYKPGGKIILIKKSDLDLWIEKGKVESSKELMEKSNNYLNK